MSIRKLFGTGACMIIIGVSAGVSYGQFQRLTAQISPQSASSIAFVTSANAQSSVSSRGGQSVSTGGAQSIGGGGAVGATATEKDDPSDVTAPLLIRPRAQVQPEPPLFRFSTTETAPETRQAPQMELSVHGSDPVVVDTAPASQTSRAPSPAVPEVEVAAAPVAVASPQPLRSFTAPAAAQGTATRPELPPAVTLTPRSSSALSASARAARRTIQLDKIWITGVYR